jgi:hypothetical protein
MTDTTAYAFNGAQLEARRKAQGHSRRQLSEMTGLTQGKIGNIERGRQMRPDEYAALLPYMQHDAEGPAPGPTPPPPPPANGGNGATPSPEDIVTLGEDEVDDSVDPSTGAALGDIEGGAIVLPFPHPDAAGSAAGLDVDTTYGQDTGAAELAGKPEADPLPDLTAQRSQAAEEKARAQAMIEAFEGRLFANSEFRTLKRCARKWWLAFYKRLALRRDDPVGTRQLGTLIHVCLAGWYVQDPELRVHPLATLRVLLREDIAKIDPNDHVKLEDFEKQSELALRMLEGYMEWLEETGADSELEILAPETTIVAPFPEGTFPAHHGKIGLIGKLDVRVLRSIDQARLFIDHKTVGDLTTPTKILHLDEQMMQYHLLEMLDLLMRGADPAMAEKTDGGIYNMLRKVKRTVRATPPFYDRVEVRHNPHTLNSYWARVIGEILDILDRTAKLDAGWDHRMVVPPNPTRDCPWDCDFFHPCSMLDDGSRADAFIEATYVEISPLRRYGDEAKEGTV